MAWQREATWPEERYDRTTGELWRRVNPREPNRPARRGFFFDPCDLLVEARDGGLGLGFVRRPTRLWAPGDVVLLRFSNGQAERAYAHGWSTKAQAFIGGYYMQYARHLGGPRYTQKFERATVGLVDLLDGPFALPGELRRKPWFDPGVRDTALAALRAAYPGSPLGTATGGAISVGSQRGAIERERTGQSG